MGEEGAKGMAEALKTNTALKKLSLSGTCLCCVWQGCYLLERSKGNGKERGKKRKGRRIKKRERETETEKTYKEKMKTKRKNIC